MKLVVDKSARDAALLAVKRWRQECHGSPVARRAYALRFLVPHEKVLFAERHRIWERQQRALYAPSRRLYLLERINTRLGAVLDAIEDAQNGPYLDVLSSLSNLRSMAAR